MPVSVDEIIEHLPHWRGRVTEIAPLSGGITNANYRVVVDGQPVVLRVAGRESQLLGIDRAGEAAHTQIAAALGLGPRLIHHLSEPGWMVLEFLSGRTLSPEDLRQGGMPGRLGQVIRRLHAAQGFIRPFEMLDWTARYEQELLARGQALPGEWPETLPARQAMAELFTRRRVRPVACHNDLLAGNLIQDGCELRIVDYEYSGWNDPYFELGNTAQEQEYDDQQIDELCQGYFGRASAARRARVWLNMIVSELGAGRCGPPCKRGFRSSHSTSPATARGAGSGPWPSWVPPSSATAWPRPTAPTIDGPRVAVERADKSPLALGGGPLRLAASRLASLDHQAIDLRQLAPA